MRYSRLGSLRRQQNLRRPFTGGSPFSRTACTRFHVRLERPTSRVGLASPSTLPSLACHHIRRQRLARPYSADPGGRGFPTRWRAAGGINMLRYQHVLPREPASTRREATAARNRPATPFPCFVHPSLTVSLSEPAWWAAPVATRQLLRRSSWVA